MKKITIVAEGEEWLLVVKPPHLLVHPTRPGGPVTLLDQLKELLSYELITGGQVSLIHRLDRETSGLLLVAKTAKAARHFSIELASRRIEKTYLALVWGWPDWKEQEVDMPIGRAGAHQTSKIWLKQMVHPAGAAAKTLFRVLKRLEYQSTNGTQFSLLQAKPVTGRMHQIRVHARALGFPIVGDKIYGPDENAYLEFLETGWTQKLEAQLLLNHQALFAHQIQFTDLEGRVHHYEAPALPETWREFIGN